MKTAITIEIDIEALNGLTDEALACVWHVAQANPAPYGDETAGLITEAVGSEIIKRWFKAARVPLHSHQRKSYFHNILVQHGKWGGPDHKTWAPNPVQEGGAAC